MSDAQYRAFISYSHTDSAFAKKLHQRLETYRMPARLVGSDGLSGPVPARLTPIFRDIDELPASQDLTAEIKTALAQSSALIVLCSPASRQSIWVAREIELFRELHGASRPIFAAVVDGEPAEVLLPQLASASGGDPIAADFRDGQDGQGLAFLKLVAGLTGASLGALVQRDAQRRLRRVMTITAGALIAMLIAGFLTVYALRARSEAERQRAEAEGLIEYMLTDLRERLKGVGRLDVMAAVNERAMAYYDTSDVDQLPPESLEKRARILHAMGEDDDKEGKSDRALEKFLAAHRVTSATLVQQPNDPDAIFAHAQSEYWAGYAALQRRDFVTAKRYFNGYLTQAQKLLEVEKRTPRALMEMGYAHGNLCELAHKVWLIGDKTKPVGSILDEAEENCRSSIKHELEAYQLSNKDKAITAALANRHGWLAMILQSMKKFDAAIAEREAEAALLDELIKHDVKNFELRRRRLWVDDGLMRIAGDRGDYATVKLLFPKLLQELNAQISFAGKRVDLVEHKARSYLWLARQQRKADDPRWADTLHIAEVQLTNLYRFEQNRAKREMFAKEVEKTRKGEIK